MSVPFEFKHHPHHARPLALSSATLACRGLVHVELARNLGIRRKFSQTRRPSGLPSRARPVAQIGLRSALGMAHAERTTKSFCRNMSALRNRISHQVDADGEHHGSGWKVDGGQLFLGRNDGTALACARTTSGTLVSSFEPPSYLPSLITITCARRGACSSCSAASSVARVPQDCC